jgi:hypothetical protein
MKFKTSEDKKHMKATLKTILAGAILCGPALYGQSTGTTTVSVTVGVEATVSINTTTTTLTSSTAFADYTGNTSLTYKIRTNPSSGTGTITAQVTTDFSPAGGPSVASPLTGGDALKYTCTVASPGTGCSGSQTSSTTAATSVATFGADAHSAMAGNSASVAWALTNDPLYKVASYSSTVTFTIAAT